MTIDHFPTPPGIAISAVQKLTRLNAYLYKPRVLDPGCGSGVWGQAVRSCQPDAHIAGVDLRIIPKPEGYNKFVRADFLTLPYPLDRPNNDENYDLIIGNPPYSQAEAFIRHAWTLTTWNNGWMVFLFRIGLLGGQARGKGLWKELPPNHVSVLSRRPSFTGNGITDPGQEYAVYFWNKTAMSRRLNHNAYPTLDWLEWS